MSPSRWLVLGALLLYVISLLLPAIDGSGFPAFSGMDVLRQGASGWRDGVFAWYANPAFLIAVLACWFRYSKAALAVAIVGMLLALSSFTAESTAESAGRSIPAFSFAIGFYLWLMAFVGIIAATVVGIYKESSKTKLH